MIFISYVATQKIKHQGKQGGKELQTEEGTKEMTFWEGLGTSSCTQHRNTQKCRKISGTNIKYPSLVPFVLCAPTICSIEGGALQGSGYKGISNTQPQRIWLETGNQCLSLEAHLSSQKELRAEVDLPCHSVSLHPCSCLSLHQTFGQHRSCISLESFFLLRFAYLDYLSLFLGKL